MKIGINGRFLGKPFTGIGQYTAGLIEELAQITPEHEYVVVVPENIGGGAEKDVLLDFPANMRVHVLPGIKRGGAGTKKVWWEQLTVPAFFEKEKVDMAIFPYPCNPWYGSFYKKGIKVVVAAHDTVPWENKKYRRGVLSKLYHLQSKKALKKATLVLTVSGYSKERIEKVCHIDGKKIKVIYNGAWEGFKRPADAAIEKEILEKFNLKKNKFFLYVGGYDERKNVKKLIEEYFMFADKTDNPPALVLAGDRLFNNNLYVEVEDLTSGKDEQIIRTGFLENEKLKALYQNCLCYVNLSKEEGFNIPIVEAAYSSAPMILSDIKVHREVAGNSAIFTDITTVGAPSKSLSKMLDQKTRDEYTQKSCELSKKYSWKLSAQKLKEVLFSGTN
ncbi:MAG: glycosyltransferase family 1 protein [Candidatus Gracilibacteria bacterium]